MYGQLCYAKRFILKRGIDQDTFAGVGSHEGRPLAQEAKPPAVEHGEPSTQRVVTTFPTPKLTGQEVEGSESFEPKPETRISANTDTGEWAADKTRKNNKYRGILELGADE